MSKQPEVTEPTLLYLHNSSQSRLQAWQMFFLHLNALLDLFLGGQGFFVFLCQPVFKQRPFNWSFVAWEKRNTGIQRETCASCHVQVCLPLPLFKLPVQSCQCELMGIGLGEARPWDVRWSFLVELFLSNQVNFFMFRPTVTEKYVRSYRNILTNYIRCTF